jgi:hypothetical protein
MKRSIWWRVCLLVAGAAILAGGSQHPRGSMSDMLADPRWVPSHLLVLLGFVALAAGIALHRSVAPLPARSARWARWALWATVAQAVEMVVHTAAAVDHGHLVAGHSTPVLTTHLMMSVVFYPIFGLAGAGWVVATARDRTLASRWIAWLGVLGALAHGAAAPLVILFELPQARILFPMVMLLALWLMLASVWPVRAKAPLGDQTPAPPTGARATPSTGSGVAASPLAR